MLTIMGIVAERRDIDISGGRAEIEKVMGANPRRIVQIVINIYFQIKLTKDEKQLFEKSALSCPVHRSLHPSIEILTKFKFSIHELLLLAGKFSMCTLLRAFCRVDDVRAVSSPFKQSWLRLAGLCPPFGTRKLFFNPISPGIFFDLIFGPKTIV